MPRPNCQPRKRFKKYHGPDFVDTASLASLDGFECDDELLCDFCLMPSVSNPGGEAEELLVCKDCSAKAHPSCMEYSPELAKKSLRSPWQCMSCKICAVCQDAENGECMLFCDSCDKGYHMSCHKPRIVGKPTGKWVCFQCNEESQPDSPPPIVAVPKNNSSSLPPYRNLPMRPENEMGTAGLPTPCDSPVSDFEGSMECDVKPNVHSSLKDSALVMYPQTIPDAKDWSIDDVVKFFASVGFPEQAPAFKDQEIDGRSLLLMKRSDVLTGMSLRLGPALKIYNHIKRLQTGLSDGHLE